MHVAGHPLDQLGEGHGGAIVLAIAAGLEIITCNNLLFIALVTFIPHLIPGDAGELPGVGDQARRGHPDVSVDVEDPSVSPLLVKLAGHNFLHGKHDAVLASDGDGGADVLQQTKQTKHLLQPELVSILQVDTQQGLVVHGGQRDLLLLKQ